MAIDRASSASPDGTAAANEVEERWADVDVAWRTKEKRATAQRDANRMALERGEPLPHPNPWDRWDPTKIAPEDATPEAFAASCKEFRRRCRRRPRKRHTI